MSNFLIDEDTDLLAAEFVLGTLDSEERTGAHGLLKTDHAFIAMVRIWERRFGELHLMVEPVDPDAKLWERIKSKVAEIAPPEPAPESQSPAAQKPVEEAGAVAAAETSKPDPLKSETADASTPEAPAAGADAPNPQSALEAAIEAVVVQPMASTDAAKPAEVAPTLPPAPDLVLPAAHEIKPETKPSADALALEAIVRSAQPAKVATPPPPPTLTPPLARYGEADQKPARRVGRQPEVTIDVIRSRGRWRAFSMLMLVLVAALAGLVASWKFLPGQLPSGLRPAQLMMSLGIEASSSGEAPAAKRTPPEAAFDE